MFTTPSALRRLAVTAALMSGTAVHAASFDGVWQTEGYGYVIEVANGSASLYETTALSCLKSGLKGGRVGPTERKGAEAEFPVSLPGFINADMVVYAGADADKKSLHRTDTSTWMTAHRIAALPERCTAAPDASQSRAVFVQTFREHYPFFAGQIDGWADMADTATAPESGKPLFKALVALIVPLKDAHTALIAPKLEEFYFGSEGNDGILGGEAKDRMAQRIEKQYLTEDATYYCGRQVSFGRLSDTMGYLRLDSLSGYTEAGDQGQDRQALKAALYDIRDRMAGMSGLVIDLRANAGGSDQLALDLAGWLTRVPYVAYAKQAVAAGASHAADVAWTDARPVWVEPSETRGFEGDVVLLTSRHSLSAAETLVMAMMGRNPAPVRVGENTHGSFSDMLPRALPNGWLFALPNERYVDASGASYDHVGIPPHIAVTDAGDGRDAALEAAIEHLGGIGTQMAARTE